MLAAEKAGTTPEAYIADVQAGHEADFSDFGVSFDQYHSTHSDENRELVETIWSRLKAAELAERCGLRTPVHAYIDVTDNGENLVCKLGLQTVPTHVLVDTSGQLVWVLARKQLPDGPMVEALVADAAGGSA